ncbi:hypothetical protein F4809DRAFT_512223 [Biscogniauxia mediterranea]|nr:hypothetical protein F4809DRAFT_512223 [Biscogniauxia mediterranea]
MLGKSSLILSFIPVTSSFHRMCLFKQLQAKLLMLCCQSLSRPLLIPSHVPASRDAETWNRSTRPREYCMKGSDGLPMCPHCEESLLAQGIP